MRFGSVCSGIEAASVAWGPIGWQAAWFSEIEPFPSAVLAHHYPDVPNHGDMTTLPDRILAGEVEAPDVFCGGTPCQAFSVAGLRRSLDDARGNLSLTFCEIADAIDHVRLAGGKPASIVFWENVPGVLNTADNAFGCFLGALAGCDTAIVPSGRWTDAGVVDGPQRTVAWRTLDAQFFGLAQRRRRVFVVASARDGFDPAQVLLEFKGVRRDSAPSREAGEVAAPCVTAGAANGGAAHGSRSGSAKDNLIVPVAFGGGQNCAETDVSTALSAHPSGSRLDFQTETFVAHTLRGEGFDASEDGTGRGTPLVPVGVFQDSEFGVQQYDSAGTLRAGRIPEHQMVMQPVAFHPTQDPISSAGVCHAIGANANATAAVAFTATGQAGAGWAPPSFPVEVERAQTLDTRRAQSVMQGMQVRRLTPVECERLQGFPDGYTAIPWRGKPASECPDGPRYKALGNSWAVPVVRWIGRRIQSN